MIKTTILFLMLLAPCARSQTHLMDANGNNQLPAVTVGPSSTTVYHIMIATCPTGFSLLAKQGHSLGCIQLAQQGTDTYDNGTIYCWNTYGGKFPTIGEFSVARQTLSLTFVQSSLEFLDAGGGGSNNLLLYNNGSPGTYTSGTPAGPYAYRCFIGF